MTSSLRRMLDLFGVSSANLSRDALWSVLRRLAKREAALLLPLRFFIGLGWLRAGLDKPLGDLLSAVWLRDFFETQLSSGEVVFPLYRWLIEAAFLPYAPLFSVMVVAAELLIGLMILLGAFSQLALLWGLGLNLLFVWAGVPNPSAFYLVIQAVLFTGNVGALFGLDYLLSKRVPYSLLCAQPSALPQTYQQSRLTLLTLSAFCCVLSLSSLPFVRDFSPHSVEDPAMILVVTGLMMGTSFFVAYLRLPVLQHADEKAGASQKAQKSGRQEIRPEATTLY